MVGTTVNLTTSAPADFGSYFTVTINNLKDLAGRRLVDATLGSFKTWDNAPEGIKVCSRWAVE